MKNILVLISLLVSFQWSYSQSIIGIWQAKTASVSSAYFDTYQFFPDGTFRFNTNQYDGLRRILSLGGVYEIKNGEVIFTVNFAIEVFGGNLIRSEISTGSDSWSIEGGNIKSIPIIPPVRKTASFFIEKLVSGIEVITIDANKYYKVDSDPSQFP